MPVKSDKYSYVYHMIVAISGQKLYCIDIFPRGVLNTVNIFQYSMITPIFTGAPE